MIRILMDVKDFSPFLKTFSGKIIVEDIDYRRLNNQIIKLIECNFYHKPGQTGYKNVNGFRSDIFEAVKDQIDIMVHSYMCGMSLAPHNYSWIQDSNEKTFGEWAKEKGITYEIPDQE